MYYKKKQAYLARSSISSDSFNASSLFRKCSNIILLFSKKSPKIVTTDFKFEPVPSQNYKNETNFFFSWKNRILQLKCKGNY